mmetsp:Transcript_18072/g.24205  ORF Transcript_18072/g.24205 Transcript_18072/m.24205 type:complete len:80 (-) Transcript_18072:1328-1567(-)
MLSIVESELVTSAAEEICSKESGCVYMFQQKRLDELKLLFRVFKRDRSTYRLIINKMNPYIKERGTKIVHDERLIKDPV